LPDQPRIPATVACRTEAQRRTNLSANSASVEMIEHVMAALYGLRVDNCEIHVNGAEMPGCDGSCGPFVEAILSAGVVAQDALRPQRVVSQVMRLGNEKSWIEARPCCSGKTVLHYELDYGQGNAIGRQSRELVLTPDSFRHELAGCRTFILKAEAEVLQRRGLAHRATFRDLLVFDTDGPIDNQLRFPDECVRHKLLDMTGDLALAGCDLIGRFSAYRSGHQLNGELVRMLVAQNQGQEELKRCA
jgi:UDP-3-O-acyl N-acetylglucosamine deacetylase